ncbi:MAG TPA: hypothetical protein VIS71_01395, partial [Terrimicrobium sp.]
PENDLLAQSAARARARDRRLLEEPHAARFDFVDRADELDAPLGLAFPAFGRFENLAHAPADIGLDGLREHCLRGELRIEIGEAGQDGIDEKLDARMLPRAAPYAYRTLV